MPGEVLMNFNQIQMRYTTQRMNTLLCREEPSPAGKTPINGKASERNGATSSEADAQRQDDRESHPSQSNAFKTQTKPRRLITPRAGKTAAKFSPDDPDKLNPGLRFTSVEEFNAKGYNPLLIPTPTTLKEVEKSPLRDLWREAMNQEFTAQISNGTWTYTPLPPGCKAIGCKWVFKVKIEGGKLVKLKARLVAQGFGQVYGVDYLDTFSPVVSFTGFRLLIALGSLVGMKIFHADIANAYLKAYMDDEFKVYMRQPDGFRRKSTSAEAEYCLLKKCLYGTKQAGRG